MVLFQFYHHSQLPPQLMDFRAYSYITRRLNLHL
jgi:hypothetical protein